METERLVLRRFCEADRLPFAEMNADPDVMVFFPAVLTRDESDALVDRIEDGFDRNGFGLWALESKVNGHFLGFCGLSVASFEASFTPAVEVGWRLARSTWGQGFATEAARSALDVGFYDFDLEEIVSFASVVNSRSQAVMRRLGMTRKPADDFDHPNLAQGHRLQRHVLFRIVADDWRTKNAEQHLTNS